MLVCNFLCSIIFQREVSRWGVVHDNKNYHMRSNFDKFIRGCLDIEPYNIKIEFLLKGTMSAHQTLNCIKTSQVDAVMLSK